MKASVFNIQKFCLHDGPGIRTTVFFKGCNLNCKWCANPESQSAGVQLTLDKNKCTGCGRCAETCPANARIMDGGIMRIDNDLCSLCGLCAQACPNEAIGREGGEMSVDEIVAEVMKDKAFYDHSGGGVTFSGGEVFMQREFAVRLARALHNEGVHVAIETAAAVPSDAFCELLDEIDFAYIDLKHYDSACHREGTGAGNEQVLENIRIAAASGKDYKIRIPVIPGYNNALQDAEGFARLLASMDIKSVQLLPFHQLGERKYSLLGRDYAYAGSPQLHSEDLAQLQQIFENYGITAEV